MKEKFRLIPECLHPIRVLIGNEYIYVGCGKCPVCLKKRQNNWFVRLNEEFKRCQSAYFITLTYNDLNIPVSEDGLYIVSKKDIQNFIKRLRKSIQPFKIRYFLVSEYGPQTFRPHYHLILFNFPKELDIFKRVSDAWHEKGFITISDVNSNRLRYVAKYVNIATDLPDPYNEKDYRTFMLCSRRPAIGGDYLSNEEVLSYHKTTLDTSVYEDGFKYPMPRYYRDKIFDEDELIEIRLNVKERRRKYEQWYHDHYYDIDTDRLSRGQLPVRVEFTQEFERKTRKKNNKGRKL